MNIWIDKNKYKRLQKRVREISLEKGIVYNISDHVRNLIGKDDIERKQIVVVSIKIIRDMMQGRVDGNMCTQTDEQILKYIEDVIKYMEG